MVNGEKEVQALSLGVVVVGIFVRVASSVQISGSNEIQTKKIASTLCKEILVIVIFERC